MMTKATAAAVMTAFIAAGFYSLPANITLPHRDRGRKSHQLSNRGTQMESNALTQAMVARVRTLSCPSGKVQIDSAFARVSISSCL